MSFGKLKAALRGIINRRDLTDALAGDFVNRAVDEVERVVRLAGMEQLLVADNWSDGSGAILIPSTYLELVDIFTGDGPLMRVEKREYFETPKDGPRPLVYLKAGGSFLLRPIPALGTPVYVQFYAETHPMQADADENLWTRSGFDAVLYGAAALAADYFQMEDTYVQRFQGKFTDLVSTMSAQDGADRWTGDLRVSPPTGLGSY